MRAYRIRVFNGATWFDVVMEGNYSTDAIRQAQATYPGRRVTLLGEAR